MNASVLALPILNQVADLVFLFGGMYWVSRVHSWIVAITIGMAVIALRILFMIFVAMSPFIFTSDKSAGEGLTWALVLSRSLLFRTPLATWFFWSGMVTPGLIVMFTYWLSAKRVGAAA